MNSLDDLFDALEPIHDALDALEQELDKVEYAHELAYARAVLSAKGSNEVARKAEAILAVADQSWQLRVAAQKLRSKARELRIVERKIDICRTREANARTIR